MFHADVSPSLFVCVRVNQLESRLSHSTLHAILFQRKLSLFRRYRMLYRYNTHMHIDMGARRIQYSWAQAVTSAEIVKQLTELK